MYGLGPEDAFDPIHYCPNLCMAWTALSAYFISLIAHATMLILVLADTDEYVLATLPLEGWTAREYTDVETSLTVSTSFGIAFCVLEILLLAFQVLSPQNSVFAMCLHLLATIFLLKFIIDSHPLNHFWAIFGIFSVPALLISCLNLCAGFKIKEHC